MSDRDKYVKAMVASAIAAAGIGAVAKKIKERKARAEANNVSTSKNTIVVPVLKSRFMEGLPTPEELKKSRGEGELATDAGSPDQLTAQAQQTALTPEEIAAKKREIVGGRKFDFLGKRAEKAYDGEKKDEGSKSDSGKDDKDKGGRLLFRDQNGKFVSPSDPVAVESVEKLAEGEGYDWMKGIFNTIFHPIDTARVMFDAAKDKPVLMTAGAVGSIILAAKISDSINKMRRARSKDRLDKARSQYVALLEGGDSEKTANASNDPRVTAGALIGGAFIVPLALSALVTNRIIENRKNEKKREKDVSDSYPDEPIILYKTSEAEDIPMSLEAMMAMIMVKRAMIEDIERDRIMSKSAQLGLPQQIEGYGQVAKTMSNAWDSLNSATRESAMDDAFEYLSDAKNSDQVLNLVKAYGPEGDSKQRDAAYSAIASGLGTFGNWWKGNDKFWKDPGFKSSLVADPRINDMLAHRFNNDDKYIAYRNSLIDKELGKTFKQGGILHSIFSWILRNTGIGAYMFNNRLKNKLTQFGSSSQSAEQTQVDKAAQTAQVAQTASAPAPSYKIPSFLFLGNDGLDLSTIAR